MATPSNTEARLSAKRMRGAEEVVRVVACALRFTREAKAARRAIPECCLLFAAVPASPRDGDFYFRGRSILIGCG